MKIILKALLFIFACSSVAFAQDASKKNKKGDEFFTPASDVKGVWYFEPNPNLPDVLILGDSISIGYTREVRAMLKDKANVYRPIAPNAKKPVNCGDTRMGIKGIDSWLGDKKWAVIHFNWGLWDLCYRHPDSKVQGNRDKVNGKIAMSVEEYEANLEKLVERLKKTGAKLIWATTTVIPEDEAGRFVGDEVKYNAAAEKVMKRHGVEIDDLYTLTKNFKGKYSPKAGDVHYNPKGSKELAKAVSESILKALAAKPEKK